LGCLKRIVVVLVAILCVITGSLLFSSPANSAVLPTCKTAPTPEVPGRGVTSFAYYKPIPLPAPADPFAPNAKTSIYEQYGGAGIRFNTYDLGCGPDVARDPVAVIGNNIANFLLTVPKVLVGITATLSYYAFNPSYLSTFDPLIKNTISVLKERVFGPWVPVFLMLLGVWIIWRARRARFAAVAGAASWALLVMIIAAVLFRWPLEAGRVSDQTISSILSTVHASMNGKEAGKDPSKSVGGFLHESVLYQQWLRGTFGSESSQTAVKYGPAIFKASTYSWNEADQCEKSKALCKTITDRKGQEFVKTAQLIETSDPDAYRYLTGSRSDDRIGAVFVAWLAAPFATLFLMVSFLLMIGAYLIVRLAVMLFPLMATFAVFPAFASTVKGIFSTIMAAIINSILFGVGASITVLGIRLLLGHGSGLPLLISVFLLGLFTLVMWIALKPFRSLTKMVPHGFDPFAANREFKHDVMKTGKGIFKIWAGTHGVSAAAAVISGEKKREEGETGTGTGTGVKETRLEATSAPDPATGPPMALSMAGNVPPPPSISGPLPTVVENSNQNIKEASYTETETGRVYKIFDPNEEEAE